MTNIMYWDERVDVANAMIEHGGSFMRYIGEALLRADEKNTLKIRVTWEKEWLEYLEIARRKTEEPIGEGLEARPRSAEEVA